MFNRKQFLHLLIGGNGSGKTRLALQIAAAYLQACLYKRVLFILMDDGDKKLWNIEEIEMDELETFEGVKKIIISSQKEFEQIAATYKSYKDELTGERIQKEFNGLMIIDDCGSLMNRRPEEILAFFRKRRQPNIDFLFIFHGLRCEVPPSFYSFVNHIILFQTSDNHEETMKHLRSDKREHFENEYNIVQREALKNPHYCREIVINPLNI